MNPWTYAFSATPCFELSDGDTKVLIDPFLTGNPKAAVSADELNPTTILVTHGHADHTGDVISIAKRTGAPVVASTELAHEFAEDGVQALDVNLGGTDDVRLGLGQARAGAARLAHAEGRLEPPGGAA